MKIIDNKNAMKAFYYLMAIDGDVSVDELDKFDEIGHELDGEAFSEYKESIFNECNAKIQVTTDDDEYYDIIQEGLDEAVLSKNNNAAAHEISARLLIWNMLAIAFSNDEYSDTERRLIRHVVRVVKMEKNVFLEMEQLIKTAASVERVNTWIQASDKPYAEVRPIVEELEKRQRIILESAKALIEDEIESDTPYVEESKRGLLDDTMAKISEKVNPVVSEIGKKTAIAAGDAKRKIEETVDPAFSEVKAGASKLLGKIKEQTQKKGDSGDEVTVVVGEADVEEQG